MDSGPTVNAVDDAFEADVDYAMLVKTIRGEGEGSERRYSPAEIVDARPIPVTGNPKSSSDFNFAH